VSRYDGKNFTNGLIYQIICCAQIGYWNFNAVLIVILFVIVFISVGLSVNAKKLLPWTHVRLCNTFVDILYVLTFQQ